MTRTINIYVRDDDVEFHFHFLYPIAQSQSKFSHPVNLQPIRTTSTIEIYFQRSASASFIKEKWIGALTQQRSPSLNGRSVILQQCPFVSKWTAMRQPVRILFVVAVLVLVKYLGVNTPIRAHTFIWQKCEHKTTHYVVDEPFAL